MTTKTTGNRVEREARLRWVPLNKMRVNPLAQRALNQARVDKIAAEFDLEQMGNPTVSERDSHFYIIDGHHRTSALKKWFGDGEWEDQALQCWTYEGLTEQQEAEIFLKLNDTLAVSAFAKFRVGVTSGRTEESDIDRIVRAQGLRVSQENSGGAVSAVGTLRKVYRLGPSSLARSLRIIRDAYGQAGLTSGVIEGLGLLCQRYNGELDESTASTKLGAVHGGVNGLANSAERLRMQTGHARAHCIAAAAVDIYNRGRGTKKLQPWFKNDQS